VWQGERSHPAESVPGNRINAEVLKRGVLRREGRKKIHSELSTKPKGPQEVHTTRMEVGTTYAVKMWGNP